MQKVCINKIEDINLLADNMLSPKEQTNLQNHMMTCIGCKNYYKDITLLKSAVSNINIEPPKDINLLISTAVRKTSKKQKIMKFVYRYGTLAAACLLLVFIFTSKGIFNIGSTNYYETDSRKSEYDSAAEGVTAEAPKLYFEDENSDSSVVEKNAILPEQNSNRTDSEHFTDKLADYRYLNSAIKSADTVVVNTNGIPLDSGFGGKQDVFYASGNYSLSEMMSIISDEFHVDDFSVNDNLFFYFDKELLLKLESRLGLVASEFLNQDSKRVSVRIISVKKD